MKQITEYDWWQLADRAASWIDDAEVTVMCTCNRISRERKDLMETIDWNWETYKDADGSTKAVYWDDATEKDRQMLDFFAKFDQVQHDVMEKMRQAVSLIAECKEFMNGLVKQE